MIGASRGHPLLKEQLDGDRIIGSAWNRRGIGSSSRALASATRLIPWWWAMYSRTTTERFPFGTRSLVKSTAS